MNDAFERLRAQLARCPAIQAEAAALYPGIGLLYLSIPQLALPADRGAPEALLLIHGCRAGQAVWELGSGGRIYLNPGDFAVCPARGCTEAALSVPAGGYEGVTLCVDLREAAARPPEPLGDTDLFSRLADQFGGTGRPVFLAGNAETRGISASFYGKPEPVRRPYQRIKALELLLYLAGLEPVRRDRLSEYRQEHIEIVQAIHDQLLDHMDRRVTIEALSRQYLINPTTLKAVFKSVYGASLAAHIKAHRMEQAAGMLRETGQSIAEIARAVGYDSQSRFTAAFKEVFHTLPTAYRRQHTQRP